MIQFTCQGYSFLLYQSNYSNRIGNCFIQSVDTINFKLNADKAGKSNFLATIPAYLSNVVVSTFEDGNSAIIGKLGNLIVSVKSDSITIKNGSLTKWYKGNNLEMLNRKEIKEAIEKLSDVLHLPINEAKVIRFDYGINFQTKHKPTLYLPYLGNNGRYTRLEQKNGLNYKITGRELCLYDKIAEMKIKRDFIPPQFVGNYGRIEKRFKTGLPNYFKCESVQVKTLFNDFFYQHLLTDLHADYLKIDKQNLLKTDLSMITKKRELNKLGLIALIEKNGGKIAMLNSFDEQYKLGNLTKKQAHDLKNEIKNCTQNKLLISESELVKELDISIKETIEKLKN